MVCTTSGKQNSSTFQGQIKVSKVQGLFYKLAFFDPLLMTTYWVKHSLESFTIFTSSAMVTC